MQRPQIYAFVGFLMILASLAATRTVKKAPLPEPHLLPVDTFPRKIGQWSSGEDMPVDPEMQKERPEAKMVERAYTNAAGQTVRLLLLTAADTGGLRSPRRCFPTQGWRLDKGQEFSWDGKTITSMTAEQDRRRLRVWCWCAAAAAPRPPNSWVLQQLYSARLGLVRFQKKPTLFVRLVVPDGAQSEPVLRAFAEQIAPALQSLKAAQHAG